MSVIIIGGGITGLAAAYELSVRGVPFQLLEASSRLGGLIHTDRSDGYIIEAGAESILVQKPAALDLCEAVGLGPQLISSTPPRTAFVLKRGRLFPLPSPSVLGIPLTWSGVAGYDLLPRLGRARLALEPWMPRGGHDDESVAAFFRRRFGAATVGLVAEPLLGGIHAGRIDTLSIRSLFPRLVEAESRTGSVVRAFREAPRVAGDGGGLFRSLADGMGSLPTAIERQLPAGSVRRSAPVRALARAGGEWRASTDDGPASGRAVVIAAPAHAAAQLLRPLDEAGAALCARIHYVSTASIALAWPREAVRHPLAGSGFVIARGYNDVRITACTWVTSKWPGRAPAGTVLLRAFIGGAHDPGAVDESDEALASVATRELGGILGISTPPLLSRVYRWRGAGAQHDVGQIARVAAIESRLAAHPGLFVAGSGFRSVGIPDCIADGRAAAVKAAESIKMG
ncbi:MAG: protoporphyrinogen oxidase [Acidobacteriota bacterium]